MKFDITFYIDKLHLCDIQLSNSKKKKKRSLTKIIVLKKFSVFSSNIKLK